MPQVSIIDNLAYTAKYLLSLTSILLQINLLIFQKFSSTNIKQIVLHQTISKTRLEDPNHKTIAMLRKLLSPRI